MRKKYDSRKVNIVGDFFEDITEAMLLGAERAPIYEGDFHLWDIGAGVEVKSSDDNHELRLPLQQIEDYQRFSGGFPFDKFFFFLFCYGNPSIRNNGVRITSLSVFNETLDIRSFLAANLEALFVIDIALLIPYLFSAGKISDKSIPLHRGVKSLNIRSRHLMLLANGGWQMFSTRIRGLGSRLFDCEFRFNPDLLESHFIEFKMFLVGRQSGLDELMKNFDREMLSMNKCG